MANLMTEGKSERAKQREARDKRLTLDTAIGPPRHESVADVVGELRRLRCDYRGGLAAERTSYEVARATAKSRLRAAYLSRVGRPIDLAGLLRQRRRSGAPRWAVVDPVQPISGNNGKFDTDGQLGIGGKWRDITGLTESDGPRRAFLPSGLPSLPPRVRDLATDDTIRRRANWVGVLYQPDQWREVEPDPALIVEWRDRPGEYFALAIWGGDRGQIEEFLP